MEVSISRSAGPLLPAGRLRVPVRRQVRVEARAPRRRLRRFAVPVPEKDRAERDFPFGERRFEGRRRARRVRELGEVGQHAVVLAEVVARRDLRAESKPVGPRLGYGPQGDVASMPTLLTSSSLSEYPHSEEPREGTRSGIDRSSTPRAEIFSREIQISAVAASTE